MTIHKATFTFTFLFDSNIDPVEAVREMGMAEILAATDTGHMLGQWSGVSDYIAEIPNEQVAAEEIALEGDGTFFADPDELAHAVLDRQYRKLPDATLYALCEERGIRLVEAEEDEIRGRWDWLDNNGNASDASLDTERDAAVDALMALDDEGDSDEDGRFSSDGEADEECVSGDN